MPVHDIKEPACYVWECDQCGAAGDDRMIERSAIPGRSDGFMQAFCSAECEVSFVWGERYAEWEEDRKHEACPKCKHFGEHGAECRWL